MKIEKKHILKKKNKNLADMLRLLKEDECLRLTTAVEGRCYASYAIRIQKERNIKFASVTGGTDILVYIVK